MSLEHSPPQAVNLLPSNSPQTSSTASMHNICHICRNRIKDKIECLLIVRCNHTFHRTCIENFLSKESECPICRLSCELSDLQKVNLPFKRGRGKGVGRGAIPKQYQTRSFDRKVDNEQNAPLINISTNNSVETLTSPPRIKDNIISGNMSLNDNLEVPTIHAPNEHRTQNVTIDYNEINRLIECNVTRIIRNLNIVPNRVRPNVPPARQQNIPPNVVNPPHGKNLNHVFSSNQSLSPHSFSFSSQQIDKVTSIIQNWGLKFDGSSNGLTVEEFLYRVKSLTLDNFNGDFSVICKNLHILLAGKARDWYWRYHKQVEVINWQDFCEVIRFQYKDFKSSFDIREEIRNRKQRAGETFDMFYEALSSIMDRLTSPISEQELIEIIMRNLNPEIRHELLYIPIHSIPHLRKLVQMRENLLTDEYVRRKISHRNQIQFLPCRQISEIDIDLEDNQNYGVPADSSVDAMEKSQKIRG